MADSGDDVREVEGDGHDGREDCRNGCVKTPGHDGPCAEKVPPSIPGWPQQGWPNLP